MNLKSYPEYKDSGVEWIGEIPEGWKTHRFKINFKYIKGRIPENLQEESDETSLPYLSMAYLRGNESDIVYSENDPKAVKVNEGDLLLVWDGSAGEFVEGKKGYLSSTMVKLSLQNIDLKYSKYLCRSFEPLLRDLTIGMAIPHVDGDILRNIRITHPNIEEQKSIVSFLDKKTSEIDKTIEKDTRLIELLKEKRTALINHVVTKGLDSDAKMKDSKIEWIGEIPENAEIIPFRRICNLNQGLQFPQSERLEEPDENSKIYITIKYIHSNQEENKEYIPNPPKNVICKKEDVLLARTGATGEVVTDQEGVFHNNFFRINYDNSVNRDYLVYYLQMEATKELLLLKAGVTTIPDLNHDDFLDSSFIIYPKEIQNSIVNYLDIKNSKIYQTINKIQTNISLLHEYKKSLVHHVVTGKVDVRDVV